MINDYLHHIQENKITKYSKDVGITGAAIGLGALAAKAYRDRQKYRAADARCKNVPGLFAKRKCIRDQRKAVDAKIKIAQK